MKLTGSARLAALDQDRAAIDEAIDGIVADIRALADIEPGEVVAALAEVLLEDLSHERLGLLAAGALLRLARPS